MLRCIKLWDKFVFNRSTQKAERRYYDFKGNIIDKPEYFQNKGQNKATKSSDVEEGGHTGSNKATPDTRPEFKVDIAAKIIALMFPPLSYASYLDLTH